MKPLNIVDLRTPEFLVSTESFITVPCKNYGLYECVVIKMKSNKISMAEIVFDETMRKELCTEIEYTTTKTTTIDLILSTITTPNIPKMIDTDDSENIIYATSKYSMSTQPHEEFTDMIVFTINSDKSDHTTQLNRTIDFIDTTDVSHINKSLVDIENESDSHHFYSTKEYETTNGEEDVVTPIYDFEDATTMSTSINEIKTTILFEIIPDELASEYGLHKKNVTVFLNSSLKLNCTLNGELKCRNLHVVNT